VLADYGVNKICGKGEFWWIRLTLGSRGQSSGYRYSDLDRNPFSLWTTAANSAYVLMRCSRWPILPTNHGKHDLYPSVCASTHHSTLTWLDLSSILVLTELSIVVDRLSPVSTDFCRPLLSVLFLSEWCCLTMLSVVVLFPDKVSWMVSFSIVSHDVTNIA